MPQKQKNLFLENGEKLAAKFYFSEVANVTHFH